LAKKIGISSPFLSDIELGRRFPSQEVLVKLAGALSVSLDDLRQYDTREPIVDLKRLMDSDPKLGFAFRTAVEKVKSGELTAEGIIAMLRKCKSPRKR
jgi:transcriptional regulator with XRE-family HTH domain